MDFFSVNEDLYGLLSKVVRNTQIITIVDTSRDKTHSQYPRMEEVEFILTEDIRRTNSSIMTAHNLSEYRPNQLRLERLMMETHKLMIDRLLEDLGGVRGVQIQSY